MCDNQSKQTCCQNPKELKGDVKNCSKEQIRKCHGDAKNHPCVSDIKKDSEK
ncbi:MAG: hypothetical protein PVH77_05915 [Phycisphaerales bacterium]|jgi:hypothetical protein